MGLTNWNDIGCIKYICLGEVQNQTITYGTLVESMRKRTNQPAYGYGDSMNNNQRNTNTNNNKANVYNTNVYDNTYVYAIRVYAMR